MPGNRVEQFLGDAIGIAIQEANPLGLWSLDLRQPPKQFGQAVLQSKIFAIAGCVLADEVDLADSLPEHPRGFRNHALKAAAAEVAAILRNDAERAGMIAAFGNLDV